MRGLTGRSQVDARVNGAIVRIDEGDAVRGKGRDPRHCAVEEDRGGFRERGGECSRIREELVVDPGIEIKDDR